ncbi:TlpA disulfide reductase family protein [Patulibacter sp. NPDC049589]|uniref:TlpA family protein disulfide reductase n=1 Tax=Patulibacter sp. NPDC049589 TaxID=3154731 RepID=UPI003443223C
MPEAAFDRLVTSLRGYPVVINVWASYCGPCRREFALLRRSAARYGTRVAFIGVDGDATPGPGREFLRRNPTLYPHVRDPRGRLANRLSAGVVLPSTIILDSDGQIATVFAGAYPGARRLADDLARYAGVVDGR